MLRPFGLSVPSSKISLISCFFRRVLSPLQRLSPQIMMSLSEWEAELKCSATGKPGELFRMLHFTCLSVNVVYSIICRRCGCLYIGETGRRLRERFGEHLRSIRNNSPGFPVAEHFNSASHSLNDIMICGLKRCSGDNTRRKKQEMRLIFELGTLKPNGLNINFSFI